MPSIKKNLEMWDINHDWSKDGDEWSNQAAFCNQPYPKWKNSIIQNFIYPHINGKSTVLEISPGHGRWTEFILKKAKKVILVDLSQKCINYCKKKFSRFNNVSYFVNDGKSLDFLDNNSIDFVWSYDSFVHMEEDVIKNYLYQFPRILRKGGIAVIHHAGKNNKLLPFARFLSNFGKVGNVIKTQILFRKIKQGCRSDVSKEMVADFFKKSGLKRLKIIRQVDSWGSKNEYNCKLFEDWITIIKKT